MLNLIAAALCSFVSILLISLGYDYLTIGYGLTPWAAFPLALIFMVTAYFQAQVYFSYLRQVTLDNEEQAYISAARARREHVLAQLRAE